MRIGKAWTFRGHDIDFAQSPISKRSISIGGHRTSVSLEEPFWIELKSAAKQKGVRLSRLVAQIDVDRTTTNLSSALRLFILEHLKHRPADNAAIELTE